MKDLFSNVLVKKMTVPATVTGDTNSTSVDLLGYDGCIIAAYFGNDATPPDANNYWSVSLEESADNSNFTAVAAADVVDGSASPANLFGVVNDAADDSNVFCIGYIGNKRYVRAVINETGTVSCIIGILAVLGYPSDAPVPNTVQGS